MATSKVQIVNRALREETPCAFVPSTLVSVLLLHWKESDEDVFRKQARQLKTLFQEFKYNFVTQFEIPSTNSKEALTEAIEQTLETKNDPRSIIIIHYGGHATSNETGKERSLWAS
jgi:hypothetical protein